MHAAYDNSEAWSPMYQRNNKRTGLKNIRCFPYCSEQHIEKGFCGRPVILRLARSYRDQCPAVFAWGEFRRVDDPREVDVGTMVSGDTIRSKTKDPKSAKADTLNAPYFEGIVEGGDKSRSAPLVKFIFNQRKKGWNYAWQASKHTAKARHAFFAYLFIQPNPREDNYKCVGVYISPSFILYCRKRKGDPITGRGGQSGYGEGEYFEEDDEEEEEDDDDDDDDHGHSRKKRPTASAKKKRAIATTSASSIPNADVEVDLDDLFPTSRKKMQQQLEPIVSPSKFLNNPPLPTNSSMNGGIAGGLTPLTSFLTTLAGGDEQTPNGTSRTSVTGTPSSSWSAEDSDEIDFDVANELDPVVIERVGRVLNRLHEILTKDGTAENMGLPQFALDWFINDLDQFNDVGQESFPLVTASSIGGIGIGTALSTMNGAASRPPTADGFSTPRELEPLDWSLEKDIVRELAEYLLEESSLTASIRQILAQTEEGRFSSESRKKAFIRLFSSEINNFLVRRNYSERELDDALTAAIATNQSQPEEPTKTLESLDEHVRHVVESQKRLDNVRTNPPKTWMRAIAVRPEIDLSGFWRLDDTLLQAFDEGRSRRGIPYMMRKLLRYMEQRVRISHSSERIVIGLKSKLFASAEVAYELDGVERVWDVAPPVPWPTKLCETYRAWIDNDTLRYCHTYDGVSRTDRFVRKNSSGDRLEMDVYFQELDSNGVWQTVIFRRGYALRIAPADY